jgi:cobalt-zinc-cadmium efflux system membrane fusion protein
VANGSNSFGRRSVDIGQSENGTTQVLSGLAPGDKIAGNGSLFLQFANSFQH